MDDSANSGASCSSSKPIFRRRSRRSKRQLSPSSPLLSVLAAVVADSSTANAAPAPVHLPFLYPSLDSQATSHLEAPTSHHHGRNRTRPARIGRTFPDKFVQGHDGRWRKADLFTFNGYALRGQIAKGCDTSAIPTMNNDVADGSGLPTSSPGASLPMPTCDDGSDWENCLPSGWKSTKRNDRAGLIVIISLVLAFFICFFIIFCLLWRKSKRRIRDVEKRRRRRKKKEEEEEEEIRSILEKNMKTKKKIWARATARWKENAHYTAWRRRGKKTNLDFSNPALLSPTTPSSLTHSRRTSRLPSRTPSPNRSRSPSRSPSRSRRYSNSEIQPVPPPSPPPPPTPPPPSDSPPPSPHPPSALPPAYQRRQRPNAHVDTSKSSRVDSESQSQIPQNATSEDIEDIALSPFLDSGHIATDDKAFLQRLTDQASSPPTEQQEPGTSQQQASVPIWRDEDISDFAPDEHSHSIHDGASHGLFPPPPMPPPSSEKGKMAMTYFGYHFEEGPSDVSESMVHDEPMVGEPSEPPFEEEESLPIASAPPLNHEGELEYLDESEHEATGIEASAPPAPVVEDITRRDSSLEQLGLNFGSRASLSQDLPVYRP